MFEGLDQRHKVNWLEAYIFGLIHLSFGQIFVEKGVKNVQGGLTNDEKLNVRWC